jgi:diguanylate cyclase (GGDEF)-like protein
MKDDHGAEGAQGEEIQGAPPVVSGAELQKVRRSESLSINRYLYQQTQQMELMLLGAPDLPALLEILLVSMPRHFAFRVSELWLYDPEDTLADMLEGAERYGQNLQLSNDVFPIQELYDLEPDVLLIDAADSRMFDILKFARGIDYALLMPLMDSGNLIGSLHLGLQDDAMTLSGAEEQLVAHLAAIMSSCFKAAVNRQKNSPLTLLDTLTHVSNVLGFDREIAREISRASRAQKPLTLLIMEIDEFDDLYVHYGERRGQFVIRKIAERLSSNLRATDMLARLGQSRFAVLIPVSGEMVSQEIAERMRKDIEGFAIDDGRGAVLQVSISTGLVTWEPGQFPAVDMQHLARQMEAVGSKALEDARSRGGNCVAQSRLSTMVL